MGVMSQNPLNYTVKIGLAFYCKLIIPQYLKTWGIVLNGSLRIRQKYPVSSSLHWSCGGRWQRERRRQGVDSSQIEKPKSRTNLGMKTSARSLKLQKSISKPRLRTGGQQLAQLLFQGLQFQSETRAAITVSKANKTVPTLGLPSCIKRKREPSAATLVRSPGSTGLPQPLPRGNGAPA